MEQRGKVLQFGKDERDWLKEFLTANPAPRIITFMPPSVMDAALKNEDLANLCTMKATSYYDDGETVFFMTDDDAMGMGFEKSKLNFEKKINGEGCKAVAFFYAAAAEPDVSKDGLDWPCWVLTISTVKKMYR